MSLKRYKLYLIFLWIYSIAVIVWGAWVRISKSGDGCGTSWPLCNNTIVPDLQDTNAMIELTHRVSTGLYGIFVVLLIIWTFKLFPKKHILRKVALFILSLTILEALIGAKLVLLGLVGDNTGWSRILVMSIHQVTSILLTGSIARAYYLTALDKINFSWLVEIGKIIMLLIVATGGVAALSNTVFPSSSIMDGLMSDLDPTSHILLKLRVIHPILALSLTLAMMIILIKLHKYNPKYAKELALCFSIAIVVGIITLITLSPIYMKLIHLVIAHFVWAMFVKPAIS